MLLKSEYSYDQYHWCPTVLMVIIGLYTSSRRYSKRIDGSPMKIKMNLGMIVQNSSSSCDSYIYWSMFKLKIDDSILNATIVIIRIIIVKAWSWKNISCSISGDAAFWNPKDAHEGILRREYISYLKLKFIALICHNKN